MNRHKRLVLAALLTSSLALFSLYGADNPKAIADKVSNIVARFPGQNAAEKDALAAQIIALGPEAIMNLCRMLAPPGSFDDTKARFALNGLTTHMGNPRLEGQRKMFVRALGRAIEGEKSADVRAFLISQVELAGKNESVNSLKKYLLDPRLGEPATRALITIGTPEAEAAILKALDPAARTNKVTLIKALGDFRSRKATKKILPYASSEDSIIRQTALYALANTGDPQSEAALNRVFLAANFYEREKAPSLYLLYARRLAELGNRAQAIKICRGLIRNYTAASESHISCAALGLLADTIGTNAVDDLFVALDSPNKDLRGRALELINKIEGQGITARLIETMAGAPVETQTQIIAGLAIRGDKAAFPAVREKLKSDEKAVRLEAIPAAARLGGSEVIPDLFALLRTEDSEEIAAVERALLQFSKDQIIPQAVNILEQVPVAAQAALIKLMAERRATEHLDLIFAKAKNEVENVRLAALPALEPLVTEKELPRLIALLLDTAASREMTLIQKAVVASANQIADPETRADLILEAMRQAPAEKLVDLIKTLPEIGGSKALEAVIAETRSTDLKVQTAAVYALSLWPDSSAVGPLLDICRSTRSRKFLNLGLQGFVRLVGDEELAPQEKFKLLSEAVAIPSEAAEKKIVLSGLARVKTMDSLNLVSTFLDDPNLNKEAAQAAAQIAPPSQGEENGLAGIKVILTLKKAEGLIEDENLRKQTDTYLKTLLGREGFKPIFNGQDLSGWKGLVGDPPSRSRMSPKELEKAQAEADTDMRTHWKVADGVLVFDGAGQSLCTAKDYRDFELFVDWKIEPKGDSGIYLRGSPQVQIWDPSQRPEGSGGLYNNEKGPNKPLRRADNPVGEWNTFHIRMTGERVTVYLNNTLVVDDVVMENYWERDKPIYPSGQVELQAHSTLLYYRNIYIRELK
jgi:HEAT repeat protein